MWSSIPELLMQCIKLNHVSICYDDDVSQSVTLQGSDSLAHSAHTEVDKFEAAKRKLQEPHLQEFPVTECKVIQGSLSRCHVFSPGSELGGKNGMFKTLICANRESNFQERRMERWNLSRGAG
ncbi:hypothetical protein Tco_1010937 [Tanacetum coccineum]